MPYMNVLQFIYFFALVCSTHNLDKIFHQSVMHDIFWLIFN